jgi:hypothetical protein
LALVFISTGTTLGWRSIPQGGFGDSMFFFFVLGWPIALVVTVVAGAVGITLVERQSRRLTLSSVVLPAAVLGAVVAPLVWAVIWNDLEGVGLLVQSAWLPA